MTDDFFPDPAPSRSIWLITLADLALLLVGFFVLLQATQQIDRKALARGLRAGFGVTAPSDTAENAADPMAVGIAAMRGFAPGSSALPQSPERIIAWAHDALDDPRVTLKITGTIDGSPNDVEPTTGSGAVLAADRARAVAAALAAVVAADRMEITTDTARPRRRDVIVTTSFAGERQ